jgi:hypothetical protein
MGAYSLASAAEFIPEARDLIALNSIILRRSWLGRFGRPLFGFALAAACACRSHNDELAWRCPLARS